MRVTTLDRFKSASSRLAAGISIAHDDTAISASGTLEVRVWQGPVGIGKIVGIPVRDENLVVNLSRRLMSRLIGGALNGATVDVAGTDYPITVPESLFISQMRWGTGGHNPSTPTVPIPPSSGDESLTLPITSPVFKPVTIDYPTDMSIRFTATLGLDEANGEGLSEEGLFAAGEGVAIMFARKTFGLLTKTPDFSFEFRHTIIF